MLIKSLIDEQWVLDGVPQETRPVEDDALYIKPLIQSTGVAVDDRIFLHSLILDNNIFSDLVENRRPENSEYIAKLLRSHPIELNPVIAMIEQRQKYAGASEKLHEYAELLERNFGWSEAKQGAVEFDASMEATRKAIAANVQLLSGYLAAIVYLFHQTATAASKLEWLSGLVQNSDLPFFQLHYYFAALMFLAAERPELFNNKDLKKIKSDMKIAKSQQEQQTKLQNLSYDLALPALALFPTKSYGNALVFPYIATRDRLVQLFLSQVSCQMIVDMGDGRANGSWILNKSGMLHAHLGDVIEAYIPRRSSSSSKDDISVRKSRLAAFSEQYIRLSVGMKHEVSTD